MKYVTTVQDLGIILRPDTKSADNYPNEGGGIREPILNKVDDTYYIFYDGAKPGANDKCYWCACLAKSKDLIHWQKLGKVLYASEELHPNSSEAVYQDFRSASSPWVYNENDKWYMFYVGAQFVSPEGIPAVPYHTLPAIADSIEGPWRKVNEEPGKEKTVCFYSRKGTWNSATSSPGHVMQNPKWNGENDQTNKRYFMFFSGCTDIPFYMRSIGLAQTNSLDTYDAFDAATPNFWEVSANPLFPLKDDLENASIYYEEENGYYFMFVNHVFENAYTNSIWVYWSKDVEYWDENNKAIVIDKFASTWAHGAIGLATVVRKDDRTLALVYDAVEGEGTGHLGRSIGLATLSLPLDPRDFK
jgi:predicted GH43/DUF377 family glycosyl hydrolase